MFSRLRVCDRLLIGFRAIKGRPNGAAFFICGVEFSRSRSLLIRVGGYAFLGPWAVLDVCDFQRREDSAGRWLVQGRFSETCVNVGGRGKKKQPSRNGRAGGIGF